MMLLNLFFKIKLHENNEQNRETELNRMISQVLTENEFLRFTNERVVGPVQHYVGRVKRNKDDFETGNYNEERYAENENYNDDNLDTDLNRKSSVKPNCNIEINNNELENNFSNNNHHFNNKTKGIHKRQKTHINFNHLNSLNVNSNKNTLTKDDASVNSCNSADAVNTSTASSLENEKNNVSVITGGNRTEGDYSSNNSVIMTGKVRIYSIILIYYKLNFIIF